MPHSTYSKKKSFHLSEGTMNSFLRAEKGQKWKKPLNISKNGFYKQSLDFQCPSKILCHTLEFMKFCQNHWHPTAEQPGLPGGRPPEAAGRPPRRHREDALHHQGEAEGRPLR
jgi:hypothetical protein